jgi:hypothetical protein
MIPLYVIWDFHNRVNGDLSFVRYDGVTSFKYVVTEVLRNMFGIVV